MQNPSLSVYCITKINLKNLKMKKVTRICGAVCLMGLLAFASTSCKKNQENGDMTINVSIPDIETVGDRAYIMQDGYFMWNENDQIRVYNLDNEANEFANSKTSVFTKIGNTTVHSARFRGPSLGVKQPEGFRVFYPVGMAKGTTEEIEAGLKNYNRQTFVVSNEQVFWNYDIPGIHRYSMVDPSAMPMAVEMDKLTDHATLHHMFGVATFSIQAPASVNQPIVVERVVLKDKGFNLTGEVSLMLHRVAIDNSQGVEHNLDSVWDKFFSTYHGVTPAYVTEVLAPEFEYLGWMPDAATLGDEITLDCIHEHADGSEGGYAMLDNPQKTDFNFMLRPLALSQGFTVSLYLEGFTEPVVLDENDFTYGAFPCDAQWGFSWGIKPGWRKTYVTKWPITLPEQ